MTRIQKRSHKLQSEIDEVQKQATSILRTVNQIDYHIDVTSKKTTIDIRHFPRPTFVEYSIVGLSLPQTLIIEYLTEEEADLDIYYSFMARFPNKSNNCFTAHGRPKSIKIENVFADLAGRLSKFYISFACESQSSISISL